MNMARYLDGVTSQPHAVTLSLTDQSVLIETDAKTLDIWPYTKVFVKDDWITPTGAILGCKDHPDAALIIQNEDQFRQIQKKLSHRHQASFIIPTQYRYLLLMAVGAVAATYLLFPLINQLANWAVYLVPQSVEKKTGRYGYQSNGD